MRTIYQQRKGKFEKVDEPMRPESVNFLIRWKNMDWSCFRTLGECERQLKELEARKDATNDHFCVVEV